MARRRNALDDYRDKRDFGRTPEPPVPQGTDATGAPGAAGAVDASGEHHARRSAPTFVVHRHEARQLHYDLRLTLDGVLLSWAVPKGFSYDPAEKRLAVRTEDHPLSYESFEGLIPPGEYGAGALVVWDNGPLQYLAPGAATSDHAWGAVARAALERGELKLRLGGRKLRGEWHLVRTKSAENHWLLFKSRDVYSGPARDTVRGVDLHGALPAALPARSARMRPARGAVCAAFSDPAWLFEPELDGRRALAELHEGKARLRGVKGRVEPVLEALRQLRAGSALLDGVLVVQDEDQRPRRDRLDARLAGLTDEPLLYYVFDLLHDDGWDLRPLPLRERKRALAALLPESRCLLYLDHQLGDGLRLAEAAGAAGVAGLLAKRAESPYAGGASSDWRRVDCTALAAGRREPGGGAVEPAGTGQPAGTALPGGTSLRGGAGPPGDIGPPVDAGRRVARRLRPTHLDKLYWPEDGFTKGDLLAYYDAVAEQLLPYLRQRPVHMERRPDGIHGKAFFQRHGHDALPDWIPRVELPGTGAGDEAVREHFLCEERDALLYLVNLGSIDLHPWLSRLPDLGSPDTAVLDLDPKQAPFAHVVTIARALGRLLHGIGLRPRLKTSGKSGLHVVLPLRAGYGFELARMFCELVGRIVCRELPEIATMERALPARDGRVYVDVGQNRRGATVVPPYVVRPVPGATVSAPLHWDELERELSPARFTLANMPARLAEVGDLFLPVLHDGQELGAAIGMLEQAWKAR